MSDTHIFFFFGNDEFAIRKQAEKFGAMFSDPTTADMNTSRLDARTVSENESDECHWLHAVPRAAAAGRAGKCVETVYRPGGA